MKNLGLKIAGFTTGAVGMLVASLAKADSFFTFPTSTFATLQANVSDTLADPGVIALIVLAIGLPLLFWLIHRAKRVAPGGGR